MINATEPALLDTPDREARAAVAAMLVEQSHGAFTIAECHETLVEQLDVDRIAAGLGQFGREQSGHPATAHDLAHSGLGADPTHQFIVFFGKHGSAPYRSLSASHAFDGRQIERLRRCHVPQMRSRSVAEINTSSKEAKHLNR